jgi:hypothetical protein
MRWANVTLLLTLLSSCGNKVDHPASAAGCDPAIMKCTYKPPEMGSIGEGDGGASGGGDEAADWSGQVLAFKDDYFELGSVFTGTAEVSATGVSGARVKGRYDGSTFELQDVVKSASNWFLVEPDDSQGVVPTLTVVDTRAAKVDALGIGVARQGDIESIFQLALSGEPSTERAQIVLKLVDDMGRSLRGVTAQLSAEIIAYRIDTAWNAAEGGETDDSGMIFFGNVPASGSLATANVVLGGSISARVEVRTMAGATTVVTAVIEE